MYASGAPTLANNVNSAGFDFSKLQNFIPGAAGIINSLFGGDAGGVNAAKAGMDWISKLPGYLQDALGAYNKIGQGAAGTMGAGSAWNYLNPGATVDNDIQGFYRSPYYKQMIGDMTQGANNAAAAGGTLGTGQNQVDVANAIRNFASGQQQDYLDNVFRNRNLGQQGLSALSYDGLQAGQGIASGMTTYAQLMAQLAAAGEMAKGKQTSGLIGSGADILNQF